MKKISASVVIAASLIIPSAAVSQADPAPPTPSSTPTVDANGVIIDFDSSQKTVDLAKSKTYFQADPTVKTLLTELEKTLAEYQSAVKAYSDSVTAKVQAENELKEANKEVSLGKNRLNFILNQLEKSRIEAGKIASEDYLNKSSLSSMNDLGILIVAGQSKTPDGFLNGSRYLDDIADNQYSVVRDIEDIKKAQNKTMSNLTKAQKAAEKADLKVKDSVKKTADNLKTMNAKLSSLQLQIKQATDNTEAKKILEEQRSAEIATLTVQASEDANKASSMLIPTTVNATGTTTASTTGSYDDTVSTGDLSTRAVKIQKAFDFSSAQLGKWYLWGGTGPDRFDCSGLMLRSWQSAGVNLPRTAKEQSKFLPHVPLSEIQPGDLVFFGGSESSIHHVGMYIGGGQMINAPHTGAQIRIESMYWRDLLPYAGRIS